MKKNLFEIPIFKISCSNWKQKKKKLDPIINKHKLSRKNFNTFNTSKGGCLTGRGINDNFADNFTKIFQEEFQLFGQSFQYQKLKIKDIWVVAYEQHDYQVPHQHGPLHWSGILYHDYVPEQPATVFIQPWHSFATHGYTNLKSLETKEGDIVFFPSFLLHFCPTNPLKKIRKVVSWDLECE
jgi:hypothetical protein|tara:strand:- start:2956 stop:3501 length:546 start_codon:yes stop_codon:yes gene_type:complete